jgi:hypothetical protein
MKTKEKAPLTRGSTASADSSTVRSGSAASNVVTRLVSLVGITWLLWRDGMSSSPATDARLSTHSARSRVLVRLPLWARATDPFAVGRNVGWALCQVLAPVVE